MLLALTVADIQGAITTIVSLVGGAIAAVGLIDAASGYSNQSSGKMQEGIVKAVGGVGIVLVGTMLVPKIFEGITF